MMQEIQGYAGGYMGIQGDTEKTGRYRENRGIQGDTGGYRGYRRIQGNYMKNSEQFFLIMFWLNTAGFMYIFNIYLHICMQGV